MEQLAKSLDRRNQPQALLREPVEVRTPHLTMSETAQIAIAKVVGQQDNHIWGVDIRGGVCLLNGRRTELSKQHRGE